MNRPWDVRRADLRRECTRRTYVYKFQGRSSMCDIRVHMGYFPVGLTVDVYTAYSLARLVVQRAKFVLRSNTVKLLGCYEDPTRESVGTANELWITWERGP